MHGTTETETKNNLMTKNLSGAGEQGQIKLRTCCIQLHVLVATITSHAIMMCALHAFNVRRNTIRNKNLVNERLWRPFVQLICNYYDQQTCTASLEF